MKTRLLAPGLLIALLFALSANGFASSRRETPVVKAIRRAQASVVNIHSEKTTQAVESLFGPTKGRKVNGMGTGIIVDERGYIVTNYHVVQDVDSLSVTLNDGSHYDARVVSFDRQQDLAIVKINATHPLTPMPLGTSSDIMLGETVLAVGNAYGYEGTVTSGIISALSRDVEVNEHQSYENLIQTDASINPGNSGGPLLNLDGDVIGINVAIRAGAQRIGFAIPIDHARTVIARLISVEQLAHAHHGLRARDVKSGSRKYLRVESQLPNTPASRAGFKSGDVVVKVADTPIIDEADFERALIGHKGGESVDVVVRRGDSTTTLHLQLAPVANTHSTHIAQSKPSEPGVVDQLWTRFGLRVASVPVDNVALANTNYRGGMKILQVRPHSTSDRNGIRAGDVLVGLQEWETTKLDDLRYVLSHANFRSMMPLRFYIVRGNETLYGDLDVNLASR